MSKPKKEYKIPPIENQILSEPVSLYYSGNLSSLIEKARLGISKSFLLALSAKLSFSLSELSSIFHISERTLQRYSSKEKLSVEISEKALLLEELYKKGVEVFDTKEDFNQYLRTPNHALGPKAPISFLDTTFGLQFIYDELGRIEHGVFA
jgi:putative toxin-antitoxin system antitoxin component (TIGR02293 family)